MPWVHARRVASTPTPAAADAGMPNHAHGAQARADTDAMSIPPPATNDPPTSAKVRDAWRSTTRATIEAARSVAGQMG
jgi:hypothetical protein